MKQIALSIGQMEHLKELGADTSKASMYYAPIPNGDMELKVSQPNQRYKYPAFTLQDIIELFPLDVFLYKENNANWRCVYNEDGVDKNINGYVLRENVTSLGAAYQMLCWCAKNGYLKGESK